MDLSSRRSPRAPSRAKLMVASEPTSSPTSSRIEAILRTPPALLVTSELGSDLSNFVRDPEAEEETMRVFAQPETRRYSEGRNSRRAPREQRCYIVGRVAEAEGLCIAEPAIRFQACGEVLATKCALVGSHLGRTRSRYAERIAELPRLSSEVLFSDEVF